jgi:MFS family permease
LYLQLVCGFSASAAGLVLLAQPVMMAALSSFSGRLSDRFPAGRISGLGILLTSAGIAVTAGGIDDIISLVVGLAIIGTGGAFFSAPNNHVVIDAAGVHHFSIATSVRSFMRVAGQSLSMALAAAVLAAYGIEALPQGCIYVMFVLSAICGAGGISYLLYCWKA